MQAVGALTMWNKPEAARHFHHYLVGSSDAMSLDLARLLREDHGVYAAVSHAVCQAVAQSQTAGNVAVPQVMFRENRWRYATGSLVLQWQIQGDVVTLCCRDRYHFQRQVTRISQPLHRLAAWLETHGVVRSFDMVGQAQIPMNVLRQTPARPTRYKRFYL